jgi:sugar phosphate permease
MVLISLVTFAVVVWLAQAGTESTAMIFLLAGALGFSAAAWNGLWAAAQAEIGGHRHAGAALGASLTVIYLIGTVTPPIFGTIVDHWNFTIAWYALAAVVLVGIVPGILARRYLVQQKQA